MMPSFDESQDWDNFDPSSLPPLDSAYSIRLQAVADLLKELSGSDGWHAKRAARHGGDYWLDLAGSMVNHPGVDLPPV